MNTQLEQWFAIPPAVANRFAVVTTVVAIAIIIVFDEPHPEGGTLLRGRALILAVMHLFFHWGARQALAVFAERDPAHGRPALAAYVDPGRISYLDVAAVWFGLFALAPYISG